MNIGLVSNQTRDIGEYHNIANSSKATYNQVSQTLITCPGADYRRLSNSQGMCDLLKQDFGLGRTIQS
jgi:hypothetical protein